MLVSNVIIFFTEIATRLSAKFRKKIALHTDERLKRIKEVISAMKFIKIQAWEMPFKRLINESRK